MSGTLRVGTAAINWGLNQVVHPLKDFHALCLQFTRLCFNIPAKYASAKDAWAGAKYKHPVSQGGAIPAGVPLFWDTKSKWDHIALSIGDGKCLSTDIKRRGKVDVVPISTVTKAWGPFLGWSEDLNGVRVYSAPARPPIIPPPYVPKNNVLDVQVLKAARYRHPALSGNAERVDQVRILEEALVKTGWLAKGLADGHYGTATVKAVQNFQRKHTKNPPRNWVPDGWMGARELNLLKQLSRSTWSVEA